MREHCDCSFCCFVGDNDHVHRFFKWFLPFYVTQKRVGGSRNDLQYFQVYQGVTLKKNQL